MHEHWLPSNNDDSIVIPVVSFFVSQFLQKDDFSFHSLQIYLMPIRKNCFSTVFKSTRIVLVKNNWDSVHWTQLLNQKYKTNVLKIFKSTLHILLHQGFVILYLDKSQLTYAHDASCCHLQTNSGISIKFMYRYTQFFTFIWTKHKFCFIRLAHYR